MGQLQRNPFTITDTFNNYFMDQEKSNNIQQKDVMKYEWMRLASFANFPLESPVHATRLAEAGFYFQGQEDEVTCFSCDVKHKNWKQEDIPIYVHRDISPQCPFLTESGTENFGIKESPWKFTNRSDKLSSEKLISVTNNDNDKNPTEAINGYGGTAGACGGPQDVNPKQSHHHDSNFKSSNNAWHQSTGEQTPSNSVLDSSYEFNQTNTSSNDHTGSESGQHVSGNRTQSRPFNFTFTASNSENNRTQTNVSNSSNTNNDTPNHFTNGDNSNNGTPRHVTNGSTRNNDTPRNVTNGNNRNNGTYSHVANGSNRNNESSSTFTNGSNTTLQSSPSRGLSENAAVRFVLEPLGISCERPVYPQYAISATRLSSYRNWPNFCKQSPEELTKAGLFHEGTDDRVRCFFCGGGLFNWEADDDPWIEHARWFPRCVYLCQSKGDDFIYKVQEEVQKGSNDFSHLRENKPRNLTHTSNGATTSNHTDIMCHPAAVSVLDMGINSATIRKAMEALCRTNGNRDVTAEKLLLKVWEIEDSGGTELANDKKHLTNGESEHNCSEKAENSTKDTSEAETTKKDDDEAERLAILEENRHLRELQICKICLDEDVSIVFLPCGHMATCASCAPALRKCPICRVFIKGTVKAIIS